MDKEEIKRLVEEEVSIRIREVVTQSQILPGTVKQRHVDGTIIIRGLAADRPSDGDASKTWAYFATDAGVLSIWTGSAWLSTTLT